MGEAIDPEKNPTHDEKVQQGLAKNLSPTHRERRLADRRRRVPDRRGVGPFPDGCRLPGFTDVDTESHRIVSGMSRRWNFENPDVVERTLSRIEIRIRPHRRELSRSDAVCVCRSLDIHRAAYRRQLSL